MTGGIEAVERVHLYLGGKTRCGLWLNPDIKKTVVISDCDCADCLAALRSTAPTPECETCDNRGEIETDNNGPVVKCPVCAVAPTPADQGVVERLRDKASRYDFTGAETAKLMVEAADTIASLRDALKPFTHMAIADDWMRGLDPEQMRWAVTQARALLTQHRGGDNG